MNDYFLKSKNLPYYILFLLTSLLIYMKFPGHMPFDSQGLYRQISKGVFLEGHSLTLGLFWSYLTLIYKGPGLIFLTNILMILISSIIGIGLHKKSLLKYWFAIIPFIPQVFVSIDEIMKDQVFTFGYGMLSMILCKKIYDRKKLKTVGCVAFFISLLYFTSVKYQARFILPIIVYVFMTVQFYNKGNIHKFIGTILLSFTIIFSIGIVNNCIVNKKGKPTYFWQYVKIYDLAGMSLHSDKVLVPKFLYAKENISIKDIQRKYRLNWEPLIKEEDSPFRQTQNDTERKELLKTWKKEVLSHPLAYLKHRGYIWVRGLMLGSPIKGYIGENYNHISWVKKYIFPLGSVGAFVFLMPFLLFFFCQNFINRHRYKQAQIGVFLQAMSLTLLGVLFVFSLAAVARYIYFSTYMFMLSVPFSIDVFLQNRKLRKKNN